MSAMYCCGGSSRTATRRRWSRNYSRSHPSAWRGPCTLTPWSYFTNPPDRRSAAGASRRPRASRRFPPARHRRLDHTIDQHRQVRAGGLGGRYGSIAATVSRPHRRRHLHNRGKSTNDLHARCSTGWRQHSQDRHQECVRQACVTVARYSSTY
jgi:hypothetical protein